MVTKVRSILASTLFASFLIPLSTAQLAAADKFELVLAPSSYIAAGNELIRRKDPEKAVRVFKLAIRSKPSTVGLSNAHNGLCVARIMMEEWKSALRSCNKAIRTYPSNWRFYNNRGNAWLGLGKLDKAFEDYEKGLDMNPGSEILKTNIEIAKRRQERNG